MAKVGEVYCYQCRNPIRPKTTTQIIDDIQAKFLDQKVYLVHEVGVFEDSNKLVKFVRKNRKQVDQ
jgi:molybdopterin synthase catalytic subunit